MSRNLEHAKQAHKEAAVEESVEASNLEENDLDDSSFTPIFSVEGTSKFGYQAGLGYRNKDVAEGFSDLDLQDSGGSPITANVRWAVYESDRLETLVASGSVISAKRLRNAVSADFRDKKLMPQKKPGVGQDSVLVLEAKTTDGSSVTVSTANSATDEGMKYARL